MKVDNTFSCLEKLLKLLFLRFTKEKVNLKVVGGKEP